MMRVAVVGSSVSIDTPGRSRATKRSRSGSSSATTSVSANAELAAPPPMARITNSVASTVNGPPTVRAITVTPVDSFSISDPPGIEPSTTTTQMTLIIVAATIAATEPRTRARPDGSTRSTSGAMAKIAVWPK